MRSFTLSLRVNASESGCPEAADGSVYGIQWFRRGACDPCTYIPCVFAALFDLALPPVFPSVSVLP